MAIFEGPAPTGEELSGPPPAPAQAGAGLPEVPPLTPERSKQELEKLAGIIMANESLSFLEPRVRRCLSNGPADLTMLLSFYRLISQALSEELNGQKEQLQASQSALASAKQSSAQAQMQAALQEASAAVMRSSEGPAAAAGPPAAAGGPANEELVGKLEEAQKQSERLMLDMQNMRNRAKIDVEVRVFKELEKFSQSLLPALDAFHQAMPSLKTASDVTSIVTGVTMIYEQLQDSLEKAGLKRLKVVGEKFDPRYHESIGDVPTHDMPDDHVYDELQPGYVLGERMVRAAMVRVARNDGPPPPPASPAPEAAPRPAAASESQAQAPPAEEPAAPIQAEAVASPQAPSPMQAAPPAAAPPPPEAAAPPQTPTPAPAAPPPAAQPQAAAPATTEAPAPPATPPEAVAAGAAQPAAQTAAAPSVAEGGGAPPDPLAATPPAEPDSAPPSTGDSSPPMADSEPTMPEAPPLQ